MTVMPKQAFCSLLICLVTLSVSARPELIREGVPYYSDEYFEEGAVKDIVAEKNYEEVFQFYTNYEVIYDASEKVKIFREYKQGGIIFEEHYRYDNEGLLVDNTILKGASD